MRGSLISLLFVVAAAGCYTEADVGYGEPAYAAPAPALVEVSPGVQVISDYDYPVFFSEGLYWRSYGGVWYSSNVYNGGWAVNYRVPMGVGRISNPGYYAHYRAGGGVRYNGGYNGGYRGGYRGAAVREHAAPAYHAAPARAVHERRR
jgi:hypothetical protein